MKTRSFFDIRRRPPFFVSVQLLGRCQRGQIAALRRRAGGDAGIAVGDDRDARWFQAWTRAALRQLLVLHHAPIYRREKAGRGKIGSLATLLKTFAAQKQAVHCVSRAVRRGRVAKGGLGVHRVAVSRLTPKAPPSA